MQRDDIDEFVKDLNKYIDEHFDGNKTAAGRHLGYSRTQMIYMLNKERLPTERVAALLGYERKRIPPTWCITKKGA